MARTQKSRISDFLKDRFTSDWKLLSETESYLSKTPEYHMYELQFKEWRRKLQSSQAGTADIGRIRSEIVALRRELRLMGYDLSLGLVRLVFDGFRNDDSLAEGFKRLVICICNSSVYFLQGSANHITLGEELEDTLLKRGLLVSPEFHYLWYLRTPSALILSGSATETKDDFARLEARGSANPLNLLTALRDIR